MRRCRAEHGEDRGNDAAFKRDSHGFPYADADMPKSNKSGALARNIVPYCSFHALSYRAIKILAIQDRISDYLMISANCWS
jgi:hypothetical protein